MWFCKKVSNVGVQHGSWGEDVAADYLSRRGYLVVERNARPVKRDQRLEIDIVAWDRQTDTVVFVEVKQHVNLSVYARRLQSVDSKKFKNLRYACNSWRRTNKWRGSFRFDVIEIYGTPQGGHPIIDHINNVNLFAPRGRFVKWN